MDARTDPLALLGTTIDGKYRIDRVIGEGGFGVVSAGTHLLLDEPIAVKCMKPFGSTAADEERTTELFLREARMLFTLGHPSIVRLYDLGTLTAGVHRVPYVVLELLAGHSLDEEIERRVEARGAPFDAREISETLEPVLEALSVAHARGIAHRDLKPSNVMLVEIDGKRTAKVVDFGIARWIGDQKHSGGTTGFTPRYGAPEQWDASFGPSGTATDVFAFGLMLAEMCLLRPVFSASSPTQIVAALMNPARKIDIRDARPDLPAALEALIERATRLDPAARHPDATALLLDFRAAMRGSAGSGAVPLGAVPPRGVPKVRVSVSEESTRPSLPNARTEHAAPTAGDVALLRPITGRRFVGNGKLGVGLAFGAVGAVAIFAGILGRTRGGDATTASSRVSADVPMLASAKASELGGGPMVLVSTLQAGAAYSAEALKGVTDKYLPELRRCYVDALSRKASLSGEVTLLVAIELTGKVYGSPPDLDEGRGDFHALDDAPLRACVRDKVAGWLFPTHGKTQDVAGVVMTIEFRRADEPSPTSPIGDSPSSADADAPSFAGNYDTVAVLSSTKDEFPAPATVVQRGLRVAIDYPDGTMACNVEGARLSCSWVQTDHAGRATLTRKVDGQLVGTWGYGASDSNAGPWTFKVSHGKLPQAH